MDLNKKSIVVAMVCFFYVLFFICRSISSCCFQEIRCPTTSNLFSLYLKSMNRLLVLLIITQASRDSSSLCWTNRFMYMNSFISFQLFVWRHMHVVVKISIASCLILIFWLFKFCFWLCTYCTDQKFRLGIVSMIFGILIYGTIVVAAGFLIKCGCFRLQKFTCWFLSFY